MIARSLGVSLRRFLGWEPSSYAGASGLHATEAEYSAWERAVWRAFHDWEQSLCPDCGQPLAESLWDPETPEDERAKWRVAYDQCQACRVLDAGLEAQRERDEKARRASGSDKPIPHRHRKWRVFRDDKLGR